MKSWSKAFTEYVNPKEEKAFLTPERVYYAPPRNCTFIERGKWRIERDKAIKEYFDRQMDAALNANPFLSTAKPGDVVPIDRKTKPWWCRIFA